MRRRFCLSPPPLAGLAIQWRSHSLQRRSTPFPGTVSPSSCVPFFARRTIAHGHSHGTVEDNLGDKETKECQRIVLLGMSLNAVFTFLKLGSGTAGGSVALVADGFHSLLDLSSDLVAFGSVASRRWIVSKSRFPFGVGRWETLGSIVVALMLTVGSLGLLWRAVSEVVPAVDRLLSGRSPTAEPDDLEHHAEHGHSHGDADANAGSSCGCSGGVGHSHIAVLDSNGSIVWAMVGVSVFSVVAKEWLFRVARRVGTKVGSRVVVANAYHHRADGWSSGVALVGVLGTAVGLPAVDGVAGIVVAGFILNVGAPLLWNSVLELADFQSPDQVATCANLPIAVRCFVRVDDPSTNAPASASRSIVEVAMVGGFLTRHGQTTELFGTLLVPHDAPASCVEQALALFRRAVAEEIRKQRADHCCGHHAKEECATKPQEQQPTKARDDHTTIRVDVLVTQQESRASLLRVLEFLEQHHSLQPQELTKQGLGSSSGGPAGSLEKSNEVVIARYGYRPLLQRDLRSVLHHFGQ